GKLIPDELLEPGGVGREDRDEGAALLAGPAEGGRSIERARSGDPDVRGQQRQSLRPAISRSQAADERRPLLDAGRRKGRGAALPWTRRSRRTARQELGDRRLRFTEELEVCAYERAEVFAGL